MLDFRWLKDLWQGKRLLGQVVERLTEVINNGNTTLFTVAGGRVIITSIVGQVTAVMGGGATNINLRAVPTAPGTAQDISLNAGLNIAGWAEGDLLGITGVPGDAMIPAVSGGVMAAQTIGVVAKTGIIRIVSSAANAGLARWTVHYIPLDASATVVATGP